MKNFRMLAAAAALAVTASAAVAQEAPPIPLTLTATGSGTLGASFERSFSGIAVDTFSFTPASVSGPVSVNLIPGANTSFFAALLNGRGFSFLPESGATNFSFQSTVGADMPLSLTVLAFGGDADTLTAAAGSYRGTVTVIPEPETYALMLGGMVLLAAATSRRRRGLTALR